MRKMKEYSGYKIQDCGSYYAISLGSIKKNVIVYYEYDSSCDTLENVEKFLRTHKFDDIVRTFREQLVYRGCVEQIY